MPSPFPGMDPYLEAHWGDVQTALVVYSSDAIQPMLPDRLYARIEEDTYQVADCDAEMTERTILIRDITRSHRVVTMIGILSPSTKHNGVGRSLYLERLRDLKADRVSVLEVDLLREGQPAMLRRPDLIPPEKPSTYRACICRAHQYDRIEVYPIHLRQPLPRIPVPLTQTDPDILLDLQSLVAKAYENGDYAKTTDYSQPPVPPLVGDDAEWARTLLASFN